MAVSDCLPQTIVLADSHAIVCEKFAALCTSDGLNVLGQVSTADAAIELINRVQPDFAILSLETTDVEAIRRLRESGCRTKLITLAIHRDEKIVMEALRAGADAYLLKDGPGWHLFDAIRFVAAGGVYISPMLRQSESYAVAEPGNMRKGLAALSPREMEVFRYLVNGLRVKDIAELLELSTRAVQNYRASLIRKLGPEPWDDEGPMAAGAGVPVPHPPAFPYLPPRRFSVKPPT